MKYYKYWKNFLVPLYVFLLPLLITPGNNWFAFHHQRLICIFQSFLLMELYRIYILSNFSQLKDVCCLQFLAIRCFPVETCFHFSGSRITECKSFMLNFGEIQTFPISSFTFPPAVFEDSNFSTSLPTFVLIFLT